MSMGYLTDNASASFKKVSKRTYVPQWWSVAAIAALVIIGVITIVTIVTGGNTEEAPPVGGATVITEPTTDPTDTPVTTDPTADPSALPTDTPTTTPTTPPVGNDEQTTIESLTGVATTVPTAAYQQASAAALALYTGDFSKVVFGEGTAAPEVFPSPGAVLSNLRVGETTASAITFTAQVDADGTGDIRTINVNVVDENGVWVYYPPTY